jgi:uncharacterized protein (TIGR04222 family)
VLRGADAVDGASWGIADSTFLVTYAVVGVVVVLAAQVWRLLVVGIPGLDDETRTLSPVEIGMIDGGPPQAVAAALTELRGRGLLDIDDRATRRVTGSDDVADVARAVHDYIRTHDGYASEQDLARDHAVVRRIRRMRLDLVSRGLLMTDERRRLIMWSVTPVVALEIVGALRLAAETSAHRGVVGLVVVMALLIAIGLGILYTVPDRTSAGDAVTQALHD